MKAKYAARFAWYRRRLGLELADVCKLTGEKLDTVKQWSRGRYRVPRSILRLLAMERLRRYLVGKINA